MITKQDLITQGNSANKQDATSIQRRTLMSAGLLGLLSSPRRANASAPWMMIAACYFIPFWVMWGTRVKPRYMAPVLPLLLIQLGGTCAMAAICGPLVETQRFEADPRTLAAVAYLAVFATLLAFGIQTWAQRRLSSVRFALISALEPVFAALWAALLIGERLSVLELSGGALIVIGVLTGEVGAALRTRST